MKESLLSIHDLDIQKKNSRIQNLNKNLEQVEMRKNCVSLKAHLRAKHKRQMTFLWWKYSQR